MKPPVFEQRQAVSSHLGALGAQSGGTVPLDALLARLDQGSPAARHAGARLRAYFAEDGFDRGVRSSDLQTALLSNVEPSPQAGKLHALRARADLQPYLDGKKTVDAAAFGKLTGIEIDPAEAQRLDARVKAAADRIGLEHTVGFRAELRSMDVLPPYAFVGSFAAWQPEQPLFIGVGVKARNIEDMAMLHLGHGGIPPGLEPMLEDYLSLSEDQRIESILVHEHLELQAVRMGADNPHRTAVDRAPETSLSIDPRVREHLGLYRRLDQRLFGEAP